MYMHYYAKLISFTFIQVLSILEDEHDINMVRVYLSFYFLDVFSALSLFWFSLPVTEKSITQRVIFSYYRISTVFHDSSLSKRTK